MKDLFFAAAIIFIFPFSFFYFFSVNQEPFSPVAFL
jgi:hypothetical protein